MNILIPLDEILKTVPKKIQDSQFSFELVFTDMPQRTMWLYLYERLLKYYCESCNIFKTEPKIIIHLIIPDMEDYTKPDKELLDSIHKDEELESLEDDQLVY